MQSDTKYEEGTRNYTPSFNAVKTSVSRPRVSDRAIRFDTPPVHIVRPLLVRRGKAGATVIEE